ncbi:hypothetical protein BDQ94DRAFT_163767 [Aspergillus welwitschiae]|uniref:Uncharacterized protein n=1 Tax=Aspergillus welwitschiae TaxID=1341132 RepID=A0A3F3PJY1_9EURO|nr:hypothetical protein BDQ94DRAFT_163767 [Aspergillus welwitschiae]RDH27241.1 hypothetical protein BDQ94DRAFT_163767 [Aspergillus welwitschiae]
MTITIKNEEADEVGRGYQLNGASTIPTSGLVEWSGEGPNGPACNGLDTSIGRVARLRRYMGLKESWACFPAQWLTASEQCTNGPVGGQWQATCARLLRTKHPGSQPPFPPRLYGCHVDVRLHPFGLFSSPYSVHAPTLPQCSSRPTLVGLTPLSVGDALADDEPAGSQVVPYRGRLLSYQARQQNN